MKLNLPPKLKLSTTLNQPKGSKQELPPPVAPLTLAGAEEPKCNDFRTVLNDTTKSVIPG